MQCNGSKKTAIVNKQMATTNEVKPWDQKLANLVVRPLKETRIHPNHLTTVTLILGLCSSLLFASFGSTLAWLASLLYMLAIFSDHLDGELARMTGKTSKFGHNYDYIVGGINYTLLFIGIGYGLQAEAGVWCFILGLIAGLCNPIIMTLRMTMEIKYGGEVVDHPARWGVEIEDAIYLIGPITWFLGIYYFFIPYALGTIGYLIWTIIEYQRWNKTDN